MLDRSVQEEKSVGQAPVLISIREAFAAAGYRNNRAVVQEYIAQHLEEPWRFSDLLDAAIRNYSCNEIIEDLLDAGAEIDALDHFGFCQPIGVTVANNHVRALDLLLKRGIDVNKKNTRYGNTPLHVAGANGSEEAAFMLLRYGANPLLPNNEGRTPAQEALKEGHADLSARLEEAEVVYTRKLKQAERLKKIHHNAQDVIEEVIQLQNSGDFEPLWEILEYLHGLMTNTDSPACPATIEQIFHAYESVSKNSIHYSDARVRLAQLMYTTDNGGLEEKIEAELQTQFRFAQEGSEIEIMSQTFQELCGRTGAPEVEVTGDIPQLYILMAAMMKRMDKQDETIAQLRLDNTVLQERVLALENERVVQPQVRHSQSRDVLLPRPPTNLAHSPMQAARSFDGEYKAERYIPESPQ